MAAQIHKNMYKTYPLKVVGRFFSWAFIEGRPLTTKGQWINSLVFYGFKLSQLLPKKIGAEQPIYIIGTGRSGTTVLGTLFSMHKDATFLNEPKAAWHYAHGNEDLIGSYTDNDVSVRLPVENIADCSKKLSKIYSLAMRVGLAKRVVDKYPELIFRVKFVSKLFPKSKFVAILRDGVDTCCSVTNWSLKNSDTKGEELHDWWGKDNRKWKLLVEQIVPEYEDLKHLTHKLLRTKDHRDRAALEWIVSMREAKKLSESSTNILLIKFEDLCSCTFTTLDRILRYCELDSDEKFQRYASSVLTKVESYGSLELMPELVKPFCDVLNLMGYESSCARVTERKDENLI